MTGYTHTTRTAGTTVDETIYNGDHQNHVDNNIPESMDDYSETNAEMQTVTDPGEAASESRPTTLAGEIERLRYAILELKRRCDPNALYWYTSGEELRSLGMAIGGTQVVTDVTSTKVQFASKLFSDPESEVNVTTTYRITPQVQGDYVVTLSLEFASIPAGSFFIGYIFKNGSDHARFSVHSNSTQILTGNITKIINFNGSTDYVEGYVYQSSGANRTLQNNGSTFLDMKRMTG